MAKLCERLRNTSEWRNNFAKNSQFAAHEIIQECGSILTACDFGEFCESDENAITGQAVRKNSILRINMIYEILWTTHRNDDDVVPAETILILVL